MDVRFYALVLSLPYSSFFLALKIVKVVAQRGVERLEALAVTVLALLECNRRRIDAAAFGLLSALVFFFACTCTFPFLSSRDHD